MRRVGKILEEERIRKGLSIEEVSIQTKIRAGFIQALESGEYKKLPSSAYVQGFVKNYISFLGLSSRELLPLFKREFNEREFLKVLPESFTSQENISQNRLYITSPVVIGFSVIFALILYVLFQYRGFFFNPQLTINSPKDNMTIRSDTVIVSGKTEPNVTLDINGTSILIGTDGSFSKEIQVFLQNESITITAVNVFGRKSIVHRHVVHMNSRS